MPELNVRSVRLSRLVACLVCGLSALVGTVVLAGWVLDVPVLACIVPGGTAMQPNTALSLLLSAVGLWGVRERDDSEPARSAPWPSRIAGLGVLLLGLAVLLPPVHGVRHGIDGLFLSDTSASALEQVRMPTLVAAIFPLLGAALLILVETNGPAAVWTAQLLACGAALGAFAPLTGYIYARETLSLPPFLASTSLPTAIALLALSVGVACARPGRGLMALFNSASAGGFMLRRLLLPVTIVPVLANWLELDLERRRILPANSAWMLDAVLTVMLVGLLVWSIAHVVHQKDVARKAAEGELQRSEERYRQLVEMSPVAIMVKDERRIQFANPAARQLVGATRSEDVLGRSPFAFVHPASRATFEKDFCRVIKDGTPLSRHEQRVVRLDGRELDIEVSASPVDYHGQRLAQVVARDITEAKQAERALRESEQRFRLIAETIAEVFWMADVKTRRMTYVSPAYERVWGRSSASLYQRREAFIETVHPDDCERVIATMALDQAGQPFDQEFRIVRPDGSVRWIWDRGFPVRNDQGELVQYVGVAQDITERRAAQQGVEESLDRLNLIARATRDVLWDWNVETDELWLGAGEGNSLGYLRRELTGEGNSWSSRVHPADKARVAGEIERLRRSTETHSVAEYRIQRRDGSYAEVLDRRFVMRNPQGQAVRMVGALMDLTETRRTEETVRQQAQMLEQLHDAVICTDLEGRVTFWNAAATAVLGWTAEEVLGRSFLHHCPEAERSERWKRFERVRAGQVLQREWMSTRKDGSFVWISAHTARYHDRLGRPAGVISVARDITQRKRTEEALHLKEAHFQRVIEDVFRFVPEGLLVFTDDHGLLKQNQAFDELVHVHAARLGYLEEELREILLTKVRSRIGSANHGQIRIPPKPAGPAAASSPGPEGRP